jgi:hypothetical protein
MSGGDDKQDPVAQQVTTTTSNLPEYARPYYENLINRAQAESYREYTPYQDQRIAGFSPEQQRVQQGVMGLQTPGQYAGASNLASTAGFGALQASQYAPMQAYNQQIGTPYLRGFQMAAPEQFGQAQADQYMSPYFQNVLDTQKREAVTDAQKSQLSQDLGAVRQGTYGGARQLLAATERERALGQQLGDIQARGLQSAYENAQSQFERDRSAGMSAGQQNLQANLGVQQLGAQTGLQALQSNQQANLEAQKLTEQSRQFSGNLGLSGLEQANQSAQTLSNIGSTQQQADLSRLAAQGNTAAQQQLLLQQQMDMSYADFLRQRDYPMEQLGYYSNLLRGLPVDLNSSQTSYAQPPSVASQLGGIGLGAASLAQMSRG